MSMKILKIIFGVLLFLPVSDLPAGQWSEPFEVMYRFDVVVSYRAKLEGDILLIEATHAPEWHTYSMDNIERARKKSGKENPETELPTTIEISGGLKITGNWYQTEPIELSQPEILWYTWGFEKVSRFAVRVERTEGDEAKITINGQVCNETLCSMVDDATLIVPLPSKNDFTANNNKGSDVLKTLVEVVKQKK